MTEKLRAIIDKALESYLATALWSSTDEEGEPLDEYHSVHDIDEQIIKDSLADVTAFITDVTEQSVYVITLNNAGQVGHDFWLTRNGHGAGFWDGDYPKDAGDKLTAMSQVYGSVDFYTEDGKIYSHN